VDFEMLERTIRRSGHHYADRIRAAAEEPEGRQHPRRAGTV
jgi:hypothetical protein